MEAEQELVLLQDAGHLHDGDGEAVDGGGEDGRGQRQVVLIQELCRTRTRTSPVRQTDGTGLLLTDSPSSTNCFISIS